MTENLEENIRTKEKELLTLCATMEKIKKQFITNAGLFASEWYEKTSKQYITKYPDATLSLGATKISELKTRISELKEEASKIAQVVLSEQDVWWHENPKHNVDVSQYDLLGNDQVGNKFPEILDKPVRFVLGELGKILEEFGYNIATTVSFRPYQEYWFFTEKSLKAHFRPYFPHSLQWSETMQQTIRQYSEVFRKALKVVDEIERVKQEIKRVQILNLWDQA
jgi:hypothetical protein